MSQESDHGARHFPADSGPGGEAAPTFGRDATPGALQPHADPSADPHAEPDTPREGGRGASRGSGAARGRGGERAMVPRAEFRDYYGRPVIKAPAWQARDIAGYFFLGGLAGAGSVLAAGAQFTRRPAMATALKISSLGAVSLATAALIHDLGRPDRFANMLRVFKPSSPMNTGSWLLALYGPVAGAAAMSAATRRLPAVGATATVGAGLLGPVVATYTAVLAADTAVPAWHDAHRELPYLFAASATAAAAGMALVASPTRESAPARASAVLSAVAAVVAERAVERRLGVVAETLRTGRAGQLLGAARLLTATGAALAIPAHRSRALAALSGSALLAGSACTRFGIFYAGIASAEDPKYTVEPQRARKSGHVERS